MPNPSIVLASLDDEKLKQSIANLVAHVKRATHTMLTDTNSTVDAMEKKLKSLGNLKIDTGGSNDGGTGRRTQQHEKLTKAVNDASEAVSKETQKLQDLQQSLSGASDREQDFISQKERAASTIAQENELLNKQQSELAALKVQEQQLADAHQKDMQARQQQAAAIEKQRGQVKYYEEELNSLQTKLASAQAKEDRYWSVVLKARETISKSFSSYSNDKYGFGFEQYEHGKSVYHKTETEVRSLIDALSKLKEVDARHGFIDEIKRPYAEMMQPSRDTGEFFKRFQEEISAQIKSLQEIKKGLRGDARKDVDDKITAAKELLAVYKTLSSAQDSLNKTYSKENLLGASNVSSIKKDIEETKVAYDGAKQKLDQLTQATQQSSQASQQKAQIDAQVAAKEKEIAETKGRIATATKEQSEAEKNASQAAKEKANIQSQVANQEKQVAEAKKQLTTAIQQHTEAETKSSRATKEKTMTLDQQSSAINTAIQSEKKYTEEIRKQAAAIRATKEWQEKGHVIVGDVNYYDKERANVSKRDKQLLLSLEEQIVQAQQKEAQEALVAAEAKRQQAQASKEAAQADSKTKTLYNYDYTKSVARAGQIGTTNAQEVNYLKTQIADLLGIQEREVQMINVQKATYGELSSYIKQLQTAYKNLGSDIAGRHGKDIADELQRAQRELQKYQAQMSRPVSLKAALGGSEKTLDDLAYKMQRLQSYRSGLNFKTQTDEMTRVNHKYAELQKKMNDVMQKNQKMIASNTALGRSWNYMKNRLAFYVTVGATLSFVNDLVRVRSEYEMNEKALGTLLNSAERGTRIFNELSNMALVSPYTLIELSAAAKQLTAYDIAAKDVVDTTRRLADISAAVGVPVERLTYALGQVKAYGHLTSQDARQFLNAGVPLVKELANRFSELEGKMVSTADVYDRMKKHAISYNDVLAVLTSMTDEGGRFFDYQAKMAETLKVRLANLTLAYNNMLNEIGKEEGGVFTAGIKGLTTLFKYWREISRIIETVVVGIGTYRTATFLAGITTQKVCGHSVAAWLRWANAIRTTQGSVALLSTTIKAIPFAGWVTAIMSVVSYFFLLNSSSDETKQKLQDIATAFDGIRKEATDLFADAISTDSLGTQLTKLKDMLELAETELGITIPVNLEDVNESNVKQKLREAKNIIDNYVNFSQTFSEAAVDTRFNESMTDFGTTARSTYTSVTESINTVKVALQELVDAGKASKRDIEILKELDNKPKDGESRIEYFQRLVSLYEELGLIGKKKVEPMISHNFFKAYFSSTWDNMEELEQNQEKNLDRLGIKNKTIFETMLSDVQDYYRKSNIAAYQFELQVERVAKSINLEEIPISERTAKLEVAINQEAAKNNWNEFAIQYAKWVANQKFGLNITISEESKKDSEIELSDWQRRMQAWANKHGITFSLNFMEKEDEKTYADRMLQAAKDAQGKLDVQRRKLGVGTGSQSAVDAATDEYKKARLLALQAGADLSSLDKKTTSSRRSAAKAESELAKILRDELSTIDKVRSVYKDLTKAGMSHANAVERATRGWDETVNAINRVLQKNGLQKLDLSKFVGVENPRELVNMLQSQLNALIKRGAKPAEIKELQTKIQTLNVDADKYDLTRITKGLNNELGKLKDEYELAVELDADPELGDMFADMFGINTSTLPKTFSEALDRAQIIINRKLAEMKIYTPFDLMKSNIDDFAKSTGLDSDSAVIKELVAAQNSYRDMFKKNITETEKMLDDYIKKYGDYSDKIAEIEADRLEKLKKLNEAYYTEEMRKRPEYIAKLNAIEQGAKKEEQQVDFDEFKNSRYYTMMFENLDYISTKTIRDMRDHVREYLDTAKDLTPEQLKTLISQYEKLEQKVVKRSPFKTLANDLKEYFSTSKERKAANIEFRNAEKEYNAHEKSVAALKKKYEQAKANTNTSQSYLDFLQIEINGENDILKILKEQLDAAQKKAEKYNLTAKLAKSEAIAVAQVVSSNLQSLGELRDNLQDSFGIEFSDDINNIVDGLSKVGDGINKITSSASSGDVVGMLSGVVTVVKGFGDAIFGGKTDYFTSLKEELDGLIDIMEKVANYQLEALGKMTGSRAAAEYRKLLQNNQKIVDSYRDLADAAGRSGSSAGSHSYAYRTNSNLKNDWKDISKYAGETVETVQDMYNLEPEQLKNIMTNMPLAWARIEEDIRIALEGIIEYGDKVNEYTEKFGVALTNISLDDLTGDFEGMLQEMDNSTENFAENFEEYMRNAIIRSMMVGTYNTELEAWYENFKKRIEDDELSDEDVRSLREEYMDIVNRALADRDRLTDVIGETANQANLSALQQGIQGITEDTAGALEAYMNGVSQQVYLHSDLLTQIRDAVVGFDIDIQTASLGQILLQLQASYQVQMSIQGILEGWNNPSGQAVRVELVS